MTQYVGLKATRELLGTPLVGGLFFLLSAWVYFQTKDAFLLRYCGFVAALGFSFYRIFGPSVRYFSLGKIRETCLSIDTSSKRKKVQFLLSCIVPLGGLAVFCLTN